MVEESCHILFEKTTMCAYQNIALAMISAKSEHITPLGGRRGVDGEEVVQLFPMCSSGFPGGAGPRRGVNTFVRTTTTTDTSITL